MTRVNRRQFVQGSVAAAAAVAAATPRPFAFPDISLTEEPKMNMYKVVFDERFPESRMFGAEAARLGAAVHALRGEVPEREEPVPYGPYAASISDATDLWYHDLDHRWRESPAAIAGMTLFSSLFGLQMMAGDAGMRTIYRAHHVLQQNGAVNHEVFGPHAAKRHETELRDSQANWGRTAANIVLAWPEGLVTRAKAQSNIADADKRTVGPETLISWIIAPIRRS